MGKRRPRACRCYNFCVSEKTAIDLPIPEVALWVGLAAAIGLFCVISAIVSHHWGYYGMSRTNREFASALYYVGGVSLLVVMGLAAAGYGTL